MAHETDGWKKEGGSDPQSGIVTSKKYPQIGKVFKLQVSRPLYHIMSLTMPVNCVSFQEKINQEKHLAFEQKLSIH